MTQQKSETKRALSQVIYRHTPGSLMAFDDMGLYAEVKEMKGEPDSEVNKDLLFKEIMRRADKWREESEGRVRGFEEHMTANSFLAIRPAGPTQDSPAVFCHLPYNSGFQCIKDNCGVYVSSLDSGFNGRCPRCSSSLKQMKYVWFHLCGQLRPVTPLKQISCPNPGHGQKYLYLNDTRRFSTSTWNCRACNAMSARHMGMPQCTNCVLSPEEKAHKRNHYQGSVWNDSWVYYTQTVSFVNLDSSLSSEWPKLPDADEMIRDVVIGRLPAGGTRLVKNATGKVPCVECGEEILHAAKFCMYCGHPQPVDNGSSPGTSENDAQEIKLSSNHNLVTFATLRDLERTISARDITKDSAPERAPYSVQAAMDDLRQNGIDDILLVQDFPLTTAAIGFSRLKSGPPAWLNSFPTRQGSTKVPVYTNCITSEAWMVKLSGKQIIDWMTQNKVLPVEYFESVDGREEADATLWLVKQMSKEEKTTDDLTLYQWVESLIHSYSHLTLQLLGVSSGLDANSLGEMLLPEALSFIIYSGEGDLGGLAATFNQNLNVVAADFSDFARVCKFDPSCNDDDGGVCVGCLYTSRGCVSFNDNLSRSYLYGGKYRYENMTSDIRVGFIDTGK